MRQVLFMPNPKDYILIYLQNGSVRWYITATRLKNHYPELTKMNNNSGIWPPFSYSQDNSGNIPVK